MKKINVDKDLISLVEKEGVPTHMCVNTGNKTIASILSSYNIKTINYETPKHKGVMLYWNK